MGESFKKNGVIPLHKLLNNPLVSCSLRNFDFLLLHTEHFDKSIIPPFSPFNFEIFTFGFFFYTSDNIVLYIV